MYLRRPGYKRHCNLFHALGSRALAVTSCHILRTCTQHYERTMRQGTEACRPWQWGLQLQPRLQWTTAPDVILTATHKRPWARTPQLNHSWIPNHRNYEIINVSCFKSLGFGMICYAAIVNTTFKCNTVHFYFQTWNLTVSDFNYLPSDFLNNHPKV